MKLNVTMRLWIFLIPIASLISSCATNYKLAETKLSYGKDIGVEILTLKTGKEQNGGTGRFIPPRKHVFAFLSIQVTNNTGSEQVVDLTKIVLLDAETKTKYPVFKVLAPGIFLLPAKDDLKINAGDKIKRTLWYTFPEKRRPELIEIDGVAQAMCYGAAFVLLPASYP